MVVSCSFCNLRGSVELFDQNQAGQLMRKNPVAHSQKFMAFSGRFGKSVGASNGENDSTPGLIQLLFEQLGKGQAVASSASLVQ